MKLTRGTKITLAIIGLIAAQSFVIWTSYTFGKADGFRAGRLGYMKTPTTSGTIILDDKGKVVFTPRPNEPYFDAVGPWNSKNNRLYLEYSIKNTMVTTEYGQEVHQYVASTKCSPTATAHRWSCSWRILGESSDRSSIVEVDPATGHWQAADGG